MSWMIIRIIVHGMAGAGMFTCVYRIITMGIRQQWMRHGWSYFMFQTRQIQQKREKDYRRQYEEVGILEKVSWIQRWDQCFSQSMIQKKYPQLNSQMYASFLVGVAALAGILGIVFCRERPLVSVGVGGILFVGILLVGVFYVNQLRGKNWRKTERELMPFLNIVDNFSRTEQDLFQIFELATPYLQEPLKSVLSECGKHAAATGNRMEAVRELLYKVEHPKFREIIQNLEICSKNEANYAVVVGDMRDSLTAYMSNRKEEAGILKEGQIQIGVILAMGVPMIAMLTGITQIPLKGMADNLFGRFIIGYWICLLAVIIFQMFVKGAGKES